MDKIKKLLLLITVIACLPISIFAIESLGTFKINTPINLIQTCASCTYNNITHIQAPNSSIILTDVVMTRTGAVYNYTLAGQPSTGNYNVCGKGDLDGTDTVWCYDFRLTSSGSDAAGDNTLLPMTIGLSTLMVVLLVLGIFLYTRFQEKEG